MKLQWVGQACFLIEADDGRSILIDPFQRVIGINRGDFPADVVVFSHAHIDHCDHSAVPQGATVVMGNGEHPAAGFTFIGHHAYHDPREGLKSGAVTLYEFVVDGYRIVHLSDLGERLDDQLVKRLKGADIVLFPAGEHTTIDLNEAHELLVRLTPRLAVPMAFHLPGLIMPSASREKVERHFVGAHSEPMLEIPAGTPLPNQTEVVILDAIPLSLRPVMESEARA